MPTQLIPQQFAEIARLSDVVRADDIQAVTANSNPEMGKQVLAHFNRECLVGTPRQDLYAHLEALSDESFKELMGWVLFGRDYTPRDGDPTEVLGR